MHEEIALKLNNNKKVPVLGFGTWNLDKSSASAAVFNAIKTGYRHIDCASVYGNEKQVGDGIKKALDEGIVKRNEIYITSKLWNTDHDPKDVEVACKKSLTDLGLEYLDLYLIHWAVSFQQGDDIEPLDENGLAILTYVPTHLTWHAMELLVENELVRSIGVANFGANQLIDLLGTAKIKPVMNQIELHPYHAQQDLIDFCVGQGVQVTAYSPLSSTGNTVLKDQQIKEIAKKHSKTPAQVTLRWAIQRGTIAIPKATALERIKENFNIFDFELSNDEMKMITSLDRRLITCNPLGWWGFPYFS